MAQQFFDNYATTLSGAITIASTSITVAQGIPESVASGNFISLTLTQPDVSGVNQETTWEVITVPGPLTVGQTVLAGVTRGTEITNGVAAASTIANWAAGSKCQARLTKGGLNSLAGASGVSQIVAGTGVTISPAGGTGAVTINATGGGGGTITAVNATGTGIAASTTGGVVTLTGSAITGVTATGTGVSASTTGGVTTLTGNAVTAVNSSVPGITASTTGGVTTLNGSVGITAVNATGTGITASTSGGVTTLTGSAVTSVATDSTLTAFQIGGTVNLSANGVQSISSGSSNVTIGGSAAAPTISVTPAATTVTPGLVNTGTSSSPIIGIDPQGQSARYIKPTRIAMRINPTLSTTTGASSFGWSATNVNVAFTSMYDLETDFDQVALIFGNSSTINTQSIGPVTVTSGPTPTTDTIANGQFSGTNVATVTFGGSTTATIGVSTVAQGGQQIPTLLVSDFVSVSSVDRTDIVGARPVLYVRTNFTPGSGTAQVSTLKYNGSDYGTGSGPGVFGRYNLSSFVGTTAPVTTGTWPGGAANAQWWAPVVGILYKSRYGRVLSYVAFGDSITAGAGTNTGLCWPEKAAQQWNVSQAPGASLALKSAYPVEGSKFAIGGTHNTEFDANYNYLVAAGLLPPMIVYSSFTPNSINSITAWRQGTANTLAKCDTNGQYPVVWTGLPTGPTFLTNSLANDTARLLFNSQLYLADAHVVDMSTALTDPVNLQTTGAYQMLAAYTSGATASPGLHPNNAGDSQMATTFAAQALAPITANYFAGKTK